IAYNFLLRRRAMNPTSNHGTAHWATREDHRCYGQYNTEGVFLGTCTETGQPLFFKGETNGLTYGPAGSGKGIFFVICVLLHLKMSMIVSDSKGTNACISKHMRERWFGHKTYCNNPAGLWTDILGKPARHNPLIILDDAWKAGKTADLITDAQAFAKILLPEPPQSGENEFFRQASRTLIVFCFLYITTRDNGEVLTLTATLKLLRNENALKEALYVAACSDLLSGDLADIANDLLQRVEVPDKRQWESFRSGAVQSMDEYSASGWLAEATSTCDYRYSELKEKRATVYWITDSSKAEIYAKWQGLESYSAMRQLMLSNKKSPPVLFLLDEATNARFDALVGKLTILREYGCLVWFVIQEFEEYVRAYGKERLETLFSQTECKQFICGNGISQKTAELISKMLGNQTIKANQYALGHDWHDPVRYSLGETSRPLMTADEVRRYNGNIILIKNQPPILTDKVGYHEVSPWYKRATRNPMHGMKKFKGRIRLWLKY
ncbi:MAG: type IV secretory system conjugative DNA transfer family protein, partial [Alphaproteobacteria bacterium]|nr:type IV secretory system conjugative DNA transfer family protein [Alphaproteobacteria bacterium]